MAEETLQFTTGLEKYKVNFSPLSKPGENKIDLAFRPGSPDTFLAPPSYHSHASPWQRVSRMFGQSSSFWPQAPPKSILDIKSKDSQISPLHQTSWSSTPTPSYRSSPDTILLPPQPDPDPPLDPLVTPIAKAVPLKYEDINLDSIIKSLLQVRGKNQGTLVQLQEDEIMYLCTRAKEIFLDQPMLLELDAPITVCGDIYGQYFDLLRLFEHGGFPPQTNYLFLGNYVDIGSQSLETICLLLAYKIKFPENFFLLRGQHECARTSDYACGFSYECTTRYNKNLWETIINCFSCLPAAAVIGDMIFAASGGIGPNLVGLDQIRQIKRPIDDPSSLMWDLVCSEPITSISGISTSNDSINSPGKTSDVVNNFLEKQNMGLVCCSDKFVNHGYEFLEHPNLVTIFSAPNFCGTGNAGAMMKINESLEYSFIVIGPLMTKWGSKKVRERDKGEKETF